MRKNYKPDKDNSTFFHWIHFKTKRTSQKGWSCAQGFTEPEDKTVCAQNVLVRLRTGGYRPQGGVDSYGRKVDPTQSICLYKRATGERVCEFTEDTFTMNFEAWPEARFWKWFDHFCQDLRAGKADNDIIKTHLNYNLDELFSLEKPRFLNRASLEIWCQAKRDQGYEQKLVSEFESGYLERFFSKGDTLDLDAYQQHFKQQQRKASGL